MGIPFLFITLAILTVICIPLLIIEDNQVRLFSSAWYRRGIIIFRNAIAVPGMQPGTVTREVYTKDEGVYFFADDGNIHFRSVSSQKTWRLRTPLPFKCTGVLLNSETIEITARLPLAASILFFSLVIIGLLFTLAALPGGIYLLIFPIGIFLLSYFTEKSRLHTMLNELKELLVTGR